jgi:spermidine dehydrogenase
MFDLVQTAHAMRDGKFAGALPNVNDTGETFDVIVVGGGASGLGAAYEVTTHGRGNCLLLDNHAMWGGEAKRNEFLVDGSRLIGPQGSNQCGVLGSGRGPEYEELWREIALLAQVWLRDPRPMRGWDRAARDPARQLRLPALERRVREPRPLLPPQRR